MLRHVMRPEADYVGEPNSKPFVRQRETTNGMKPTPESGPLPSAIVQRPRLHRLLAGVAAPGIVTVCARAAQGKSTLIADYLQSTAKRACWVQLGPADADPNHFVGHLIECVANGCSRGSRATAVSRQKTGPERIGGILAGLPPDIHLVLDGWHRMGVSSQTRQWIDAIVAARPPRGCTYFLSRENLPLALQRHRMRRQALVLGDQDLDFTEDEIVAFFQTTSAIELSPGHRRQIHALTSGWVGGLVLMAEELHRHPATTEAALMAPAMRERFQREAGRYLREEVFHPQPEAMRVFLTQAALLDTMPAALMRKLFGPRMADRLAEEAVRQHLFVQFDPAPSGVWSLRMHPLLRTYLSGRAQTDLSAKEREHILKEAAQHYRQQGDLESAAGYDLRAEDFRTAARTITTIGMELLIKGRFADIATWMSRLPPAQIGADPWLSLLQAAAHRVRGGRRTIAELQAAGNSFTRAKHVRGQMLALAYLIETAVFNAYAPDSVAPWLASGEELLRTTHALPHFVYAKALLWQQLGFGTLADPHGDLHKGLSACENAVVLGKRIGSRSLVANSQAIAARGQVQFGEFDQARERLKAAQDPGGDDLFPEYAALRHLAEFHLAFIEARPADAEAKLEAVRDAIDRYALTSLYPSSLEATGLMQIHHKAFAALEKTQRHLHDVAVLLNDPAHRAVGYWLAGLGGYHQGQFTRARALIRHAEAIPQLSAIQQARNQALMGLIDLNSGVMAEADRHLSAALMFFEDRGLSLYACTAQIGLALVRYAAQDIQTAANLLAIAFRTAARQTYENLYLLRPVDLARACALAIQHEIPGASQHARHLLAERLEETEIQTLVSGREDDPVALSIDARKASHAIYRARVPVLTIRTLGGLQILRSGSVPLGTRDWQGSRPALLFKAILVHGGRHIPKDILLEAVWPDHPPKKSLRNFKVTLHRLRKMLEPDLDSTRGSSYIHLKDNLVSLDKHLCQVDTDALHKLCRRARRIDTAVEARELQAMRREASALYRGDFLPEEPYLTWAEMKRTTLRQEFMQLMYRLGRHLEAQQAFAAARRCYRQIIKLDPAQEKAQRHLMRLLDADGRPQEALQLYEAMCRFLQTEIGAIPDRATVELGDRIRLRPAAD